MWARPAVVKALEIIADFEPTSTHQFGRLLWPDDERWTNRKLKNGKVKKRGVYRLGRNAASVMSRLVRDKYVTRDKETGIYEPTALGYKVLAMSEREDD